MAETRVPVPNQVRVTGLPKVEEIHANRKAAEAEIVSNFEGAESAKYFRGGIAYIALRDEASFKEALARNGSKITIAKHRCTISIGQLYQKPQATNEEAKMSGHAKPDPKQEAKTENTAEEAKKSAKEGVKDEVFEGVTTAGAMLATSWLARLLGAFLTFLLGKKAGQKGSKGDEGALGEAARAAGERLNAFMKDKLKRRHDDWIRILAKMQNPSRQKLTAWIGNQDLVDRGFHNHFVTCFHDHITRDVPKNDKGLPELSPLLIKEAADVLTDFIEYPVTPGPIGNENRINRAIGMCGYKTRTDSHVEKGWKWFMELRRQANHAIDQNNPDFQPKPRHHHHHTPTHDAPDGSPIRLL